MTSSNSNDQGGWGFWFRSNFDKMLLTGLFVFVTGIVLHMSHDSIDHDHILWARELAGTIMGALLGLITGHLIAAKMSAKSTKNSSEASAEGD